MNSKHDTCTQIHSLSLSCEVALWANMYPSQLTLQWIISHTHNYRFNEHWLLSRCLSYCDMKTFHKLFLSIWFPNTSHNGKNNALESCWGSSKVSPATEKTVNINAVSLDKKIFCSYPINVCSSFHKEHPIYIYLYFCQGLLNVWIYHIYMLLFICGTIFYFCYYSLLLAHKFKDLANVLPTDDQNDKYQGANPFPQVTRNVSITRMPQPNALNKMASYFRYWHLSVN